MRTKVTLVLLFLNVVLFYYISHFEKPINDGKHGKSVYGSEVASIVSFERKERGGVTVLLEKEKQGENWKLTKPYEWPANPNAIAGIISDLQHLDHETSFPVVDVLKNGRSLADYGLADPILTFTFKSGGKTYETKVGDTTKVGNRLYLLSPDGTQIHVVGSSLIDSIGLSLDRLRSESIFSIPVFEVRSLSIQNASKVRLRREGPRWTFETPILTRANKNAVETTINALNGLQVQKFLEPREAADPAVTGLTSTDLIRITLEGNARRETLLVGNPVVNPASVARPETESTPHPTLYYAKIEDKTAVFTTALPSKLLESIRHAQEDLRDAHILEFERHNVTAITLATGQSEVNLQRLEPVSGTEAWQIIARGVAAQAPQPLAADTAVVTNLLQQLESFAAKKYLTDTPSDADLENYGFNRPEREITLNLSNGGGPNFSDPSTLSLKIGVKPEEHGVAYARLSNALFVYQVDPSIMEFTPVDSRYFRQRLLSELKEGTRITGLNLTEIGNPVPLFARQLHEGDTWETALGTEPENRQKALTALLAQLRMLRAQRFVAESFNPDHAESNGTVQPWKYRLEITLALTGGNAAVAQSSSTVLWLTERLGGTTQLAGTTEFGVNGVTFSLTQEMLDPLFTLTYGEKHDPGPPKADPVPGP